MECDSADDKKYHYNAWRLLRARLEAGKDENVGATSTCRICFEEIADMSALLRPDHHVCGCRGISESCHPSCLLTWVRAKSSNPLTRGECEICRERYNADAYAQEEDRDALTAALDAEPPSPSTSPSPAPAPSPSPQAVDDIIVIEQIALDFRFYFWIFRLILFCINVMSLLLFIITIFRHNNPLYQECVNIVNDATVNPMMRNACYYASRSKSNTLMKKALSVFMKWN